MRKNLVLALLLSFPMASFCQHHGLTHNIETNVAYVQWGSVKGSELNVKYAASVLNHLDILASLSVSNGVDFSHHHQGFSINEQQGSDILEVGIRGNVDFLKKCSFKLEARCGGIWLVRAWYREPDWPATWGSLRFATSGQAEFDVRLTPIFSMGVFAGKTWMFDELCPFTLDRMGLSLCFQFQ